jgi:hypothetical protein
MPNRPYYLRLGQILIHLNVIDNTKVTIARRKQVISESSKRIGEIMIESGYITEDELNKGLSLQRDLDMHSCT